MTNLKFQFYSDEKLLKKIVFTGSETKIISIGKNGKDVSYQAEEISRMHAQLIYDGNSVYIVDSNSTNGTFINDRRVISNEPQLLKKNDVIVFGPSKISKLLVTEIAKDLQEDDYEGSFGKTIFGELKDKNEMWIGRSPECDIVLRHESVSRKHATVKKIASGKYIVTDNNSTNGVFVNGQRIKSAEITLEDKLYIGRFQLTLQGVQKNLSCESSVRADYVSKEFKKDAKVFKALTTTSFDLPSGGIIAIMGPTGCGKSTLLKVLNGTIFPTTGSVFINGLELIENLPYLKTQIGYVPQDDIIHGELTVKESIFYAAKIRLNGADDETVEKKIKYLLDKLKLTHRADQCISALSGGQRKRVCIAVELLSDPAILFLDEPTSPLDPQTIEEFMNILRDLSKSGTTVIMVTHKPEDLEYMDKVIFMAVGGSIVFYGNVDEYKGYFEVKKTVEVYANISGDKAAYWVNKFNESAAKREVMPLVSVKRKKTEAKPFSQFYWMLKRYSRIKLNDKKNTAIMIFQAPIIALLICFIFKEIKLAVLFLMSISAIWFGVNNSAREIVCEAAIYKRERMFNLLIFPYVFSKIVLLALFAIIQSILFISIITLFYSGSWHEVHWTAFMPGIIWMFFITLCSSLLGLFISAVSGSAEKAMSVVPIVIIPQIMLAGVVAVIKSSAVELLSYSTISRWGTEGFTHMQDSVFEATTMKLNQIPIIRQEKFVAFDALKKSFEGTYNMVFDKYAGTFSLNMTVLLCMCILYLAGTWIALIKKDKHQL